jgi:hypothetical protein
LVVVPFAAVTTTVIVFEPTLKEMFPVAEPEFTDVPFTVIVAPASLRVGVTVIVKVAFETVAV